MSESRPCRFCRAEITMLQNDATGKTIPAQRIKTIYLLVDGKLRKLELSGAFYANHFETCPDADKASRGKQQTR